MGIFDKPAATTNGSPTAASPPPGLFGATAPIPIVPPEGAGTAVIPPDAPADMHIPPFKVGDKVCFEGGEGVVVELQNKGVTAYVRIGSDKAVSKPCRELWIAPVQEDVSDAEKKPKRGRPPKLPLQAMADAPESAVGAVIAPPTPVAVAPAARTQIVAVTQPGFDLGVGALPAKLNGASPSFVTIEDWARPAMDAAAKDNGVAVVAHYRMLDFGKSKGALAVQIMKLLETSLAAGTMPALIFIADPHTPLGEVAHEILTPSARSVWRRVG